MSDDLIRRGDAAKICDDEAAKFASKADAAAASVAAGETTNEPFFVACMLASIRLRAAAEEIRSLPAVAREPEAAPRLPACGIVRDRDADTAVAKKAIEDYIAGLRDSHGEPTSDRAEVQIAAGEPLLLEKLGRAKSPSPPTCATCGGSGEVVGLEGDDESATTFVPCPACAGGRRA